MKELDDSEVVQLAQNICTYSSNITILEEVILIMVSECINNFYDTIDYLEYLIRLQREINNLIAREMYK